MKQITLKGTTDASGDLTVTDPNHIIGLLYAVQLIDGSFDDGVDITITSEHGDLAMPNLVMANFNSDQMQYPRVLETLNTSGAALSTHCMPIVNGKPKMVIAQGGNAKTGGCVLYIIEP